MPSTEKWAVGQGRDGRCTRTGRPVQACMHEQPQRDRQWHMRLHALFNLTWRCSQQEGQRVRTRGRGCLQNPPHCSAQLRVYEHVCVQWFVEGQWDRRRLGAFRSCLHAATHGAYYAWSSHHTLATLRPAAGSLRLRLGGALPAACAAATAASCSASCSSSQLCRACEVGLRGRHTI